MAPRLSTHLRPEVAGNAHQGAERSFVHRRLSTEEAALPSADCLRQSSDHPKERGGSSGTGGCQESSLLSEGERPKLLVVWAADLQITTLCHGWDGDIQTA